MTFRAKELSADQKTVIEGLCSLGEDEAISIRVVGSDAAGMAAPVMESAKALGVDQLSVDEIDAEIEAARKARRSAAQLF